MTPSVQAAFNATALALGMKAEWLNNVIALESNWKPTAYNTVSGATGLIQFIPRTMKDLGLLSKDLAASIPASGIVPEEIKQAARREFLAKYSTIESQLKGPVLKYLKMWGPFPTEQAAYMAVFYPAFRYVPPDTLMPDSVRKQNPGINTVGDYIAAVKKKISFKSAVKVGTAILGIAVIAGLGYYLYRRR